MNGKFSVSKLLLIIGAVCFFLAAVTVAGSNVLGAPAWAWGFGGLCAWCLAGALP
jgi:hypothetical protein